jgi:hypothetical protein
MRAEPLEESYFNWLCAKVNRVEVPTPSLTYVRLLRALHTTEFVWTVAGDKNRSEDGLDLRLEFLRASGFQENTYWRFEGCSLLEMLIAFSRRAAFETGDPESDWFWIFMDNLGLAEYNDASGFGLDDLAVILYDLVWRTYNYDGRGGIFPLDHPSDDQRQVEIWYQFCAWLVEKEG